MMAAIRAAQLSDRVALFEKNASLGRKLGLTGQGRCNISHACTQEEFLTYFGKNGLFLRDALRHFSIENLCDFFNKQGLKLKTERQARIFPETDSSRSVIEVLEKALEENRVKIHLRAPLKNVLVHEGKAAGVRTVQGEDFFAQKVILATGGASYPETGSTGDGFRIAQSMGHKVVDLHPGLVPLETKERFVKNLQGLTLKNVRLIFYLRAKKIESEIGELLFTHFGISGPLILDISAEINAKLDENKEIRMAIDLKPGLSHERIDSKLQRDFQNLGTSMIKNYLGQLLPKRLVEVFLVLSSIPSEKRCHQITSKERTKIIETFKALPLTITGSRPLPEAMVTVGGISLKEVNPKTMASKKIFGLYFCGEILDVAAASGGFNLQAAFSTGHLAGESAAMSLAS